MCFENYIDGVIWCEKYICGRCVCCFGQPKSVTIQLTVGWYTVVLGCFTGSAAVEAVLGAFYFDSCSSIIIIRYAVKFLDLVLIMRLYAVIRWQRCGGQESEEEMKTKELP